MEKSRKAADPRQHCQQHGADPHTRKQIIAAVWIRVGLPLLGT